MLLSNGLCAPRELGLGHSPRCSHVAAVTRGVCGMNAKRHRTCRTTCSSHTEIAVQERMSLTYKTRTSSGVGMSISPWQLPHHRRPLASFLQSTDTHLGLAGTPPAPARPLLSCMSPLQAMLSLTSVRQLLSSDRPSLRARGRGHE